MEEKKAIVSIHIMVTTRISMGLVGALFIIVIVVLMVLVVFVVV
jgi:hypothetical protein